MENQYVGVLELTNHEVRNALHDKAVVGYDGRKAQIFFKNNPNAKGLGLALLKEMSPKEAQELFSSYCRYSETTRGIILQRYTAKKEAGTQEMVLAQ